MWCGPRTFEWIRQVFLDVSSANETKLIGTCSSDIISKVECHRLKLAMRTCINGTIVSPMEPYCILTQKKTKIVAEYYNNVQRIKESCPPNHHIHRIEHSMHEIISIQI